MVENIKFTLYEFLGYLLPGGLSAFAFSILFGTAFYPHLPFPVYLIQSDLAFWAVIAVSAYACGHLTQALGNLLPSDAEARLLPENSDCPVVRLARETTARMLSTEAKSVTPKCLYGFCDEYVAQNGQAGDRDLYIYREGFYRGNTVALVLLVVSVLARLCVRNPALRFTRYTVFVTPLELIVVAAFLLWSSWLAYRRFKRFGDYRVRRAITAFVCVTSKTSTQ